MKAVLVGGIEDEKLYYVIDSKGSSKDGVLVAPDGRAVMIRFFSWVSQNPGIRKIRNTKFHRFLWDSPADPSKGKWFDVFIGKNIEIDKSMLDGVVVTTDIKPSQKIIKKKIDNAGKSMSTKKDRTMILSNKALFRPEEAHRAWLLMKLFDTGEN
jgi:hypothetical protein